MLRSLPVILILAATCLICVTHLIWISSTIGNSSASTKNRPLIVEQKHSCPNSRYWFHNEASFASLLTCGRKPLMLLDLLSKVKYVERDDDNEMPRRSSKKYDHESCFIMKARYNCAGNHSNSSRIANYKMVLVHNDTVSCDLESFIVDVLNGPGGVLVENRNTSAATKGRRTFNVVLHGNSFLRQVFEALTCTYRQQITDAQFYVGGPRIQLGVSHIRQTEMGRAFDYFNYTTTIRSRGGNPVGCHGFTDKENARFYAADVKVPETIPECTDDVAMVEFQKTIRFYYVFRPSLYDNLTDVYTTTLGLRPSEVDFLVFNIGYKRTYPRELRELLGPGIYESALEYSALDYIKADRETWKTILMRDVGFWPGCDNPGMFHPPDIHTCMPGIPEDQANLLLFVIFRFVQCQRLLKGQQDG